MKSTGCRRCTFDARNNAQSVFNFYLSFVTAVTGGAIFILQAAESIASIQARITLIILLFFSTMVGSVYLSALSGRYAQSARYARILDSLRRLQLQHIQPPLPKIYDTFIEESDDAHHLPRDAWFLWLVPTGTFQMFIAFVNSASLALIVGLILGLGDTSLKTGSVVIIAIFLITLTIYNIYSRMVINRFSYGFDVRIDLGKRFGMWASRQ